MLRVSSQGLTVVSALRLASAHRLRLRRNTSSGEPNHAGGLLPPHRQNDGHGSPPLAKRESPDARVAPHPHAPSENRSCSAEGQLDQHTVQSNRLKSYIACLRPYAPPVHVPDRSLSPEDALELRADLKEELPRRHIRCLTQFVTVRLRPSVRRRSKRGALQLENTSKQPQDHPSQLSDQGATPRQLAVVHTHLKPPHPHAHDPQEAAHRRPKRSPATRVTPQVNNIPNQPQDHTGQLAGQRTTPRLLTMIKTLITPHPFPPHKQKATHRRRKRPSPDSGNAPTRETFLHILQTTTCPHQGWHAYISLHALPRPSLLPLTKPDVPYHCVHRLAALLAAAHPRTRTTFLRLLSLLGYVRSCGSHLFAWEVNALVDCAGKGWRKTTAQELMNALGIFYEWFEQRGRDDAEDITPGPASDKRITVYPDINTYTTLITIAVRTRSAAHVQRTTALLRSSGLAPNRITHLTLMRYFTRVGDLRGVRTTLEKMDGQGLEVGLEGVNAVLWAYGYNRHLDVASAIYRVLRYNLLPPSSSSPPTSILQDTEYLATTLHLTIPRTLVPDSTTYVSVVQTHAYHGDLLGALQAFQDMTQAQPAHSPDATTATFAAFRALFLGFARHAALTTSGRAPVVLGIRQAERQPGGRSSLWAREYLDPLFEVFIAGTTVPSERLVYWILVAFAQTTDHDVRVLREVFARLEGRFGRRWEGGRLGVIRSKLDMEE